MWRGHRRRYDPIDHGSSLVVSGRFHPAPSGSTVVETWPALYAALDLAVALGEMIRSDPKDRLKEYRFTEILVDLQAVADCRDLAALGIGLDRLLDDWDFSTSQALAHSVRNTDAEGMLVPSASGLGDNLIVFPDRLRSGSTLTPIRTLDPSLTKEPR